MEIRLSLNGDIADSLRTIKLCLLYFDNIIIDIPLVVDMYEEFNSTFFLCNEDVFEQYKWLAKNNIVSLDYTVKNIYSEYLNSGAVQIATSEFVNYELHKNLNRIFSDLQIDSDNDFTFTPDTKIILTEYKDVVKEIPFIIKKTILCERTQQIVSSHNYDNYTCYVLLENLLSDIYVNITTGKISITNSPFLNKIINDFFTENVNQKQNMTMKQLEYASILLPDLSNASFEDILEIRYKMKDELLELKQYINSLLNVNEKDNIDQIIQQKINYAIRNLELKIKDIKINVAQKFLTEIKNPLSYTPLIGTVLNDIPAHVSLLMSLGLIGANVGLEYIKQLNNIKKDNMYFLFKFNKMM